MNCDVTVIVRGDANRYSMLEISLKSTVTSSPYRKNINCNY